MKDSIIIDLCGRLADPIGPSLTMVLGVPTPVVAVLTLLAADYPALAVVLADTRVHIAVDEVLASPEALIAPGQRLALFPPVSGG